MTLTAASEPRACICYVIDEGYLFPALVSAMQARRFTSESLADVVIACVGDLSPRAEFVIALAARYGVKILPVTEGQVDQMHPMFGRMFMDAFLPERYQRVVYIDADTQIAGNLDPLITASFPDDVFLACRDPSTLFSQISSVGKQRHAERCAKIGFRGEPMNYVNSGVLVVNRSSWKALADQCLQDYHEHADIYAHPDQDALNVSVGDHTRVISNKWNFPGFLLGSRAEAERVPHIIHFMSNPRPWNASVSPWGRRWSQPYADLLTTHPELRAIAPTLGRSQILRYIIQQEFKMLLEYRRVGKIAAEPPVTPLAP